jgi:hypothetical protein
MTIPTKGFATGGVPNSSLEEALNRLSSAFEQMVEIQSAPHMIIRDAAGTAVGVRRETRKEKPAAELPPVDVQVEEPPAISVRVVEAKKPVVASVAVPKPVVTTPPPFSVRVMEDIEQPIGVRLIEESVPHTMVSPQRLGVRIIDEDDMRPIGVRIVNEPAPKPPPRVAKVAPQFPPINVRIRG